VIGEHYPVRPDGIDVHAAGKRVPFTQPVHVDHDEAIARAIGEHMEVEVQRRQPGAVDDLLVERQVAVGGASRCAGALRGARLHRWRVIAGVAPGGRRASALISAACVRSLRGERAGPGRRRDGRRGRWRG